MYLNINHKSFSQRKNNKIQRHTLLLITKKHSQMPINKLLKNQTPTTNFQDRRT